VNGERRLTPREMFRLQGFPDSYKIVVSDMQARKQAGNSIPVNVVNAVASKLIPFVAKTVDPVHVLHEYEVPYGR
jgi:DNA (cytosine-5)-methyltransferase 1